jgi:transposase
MIARRTNRSRLRKTSTTGSRAGLQHGSDAVEGHVNRIKAVKRQMYGRASFPLLDVRILVRP